MSEEMSRAEQAIIDGLTRFKGNTIQEELVRAEAELDDALSALFVAVKHTPIETRRCLDRVLQAAYNLPVLAIRMAGAYQPDLAHDINESPIRVLPSRPHLENLLFELIEKYNQWADRPPSFERAGAIHHLAGLTEGLRWLLEQREA